MVVAVAVYVKSRNRKNCDSSLFLKIFSFFSGCRNFCYMKHIFMLQSLLRVSVMVFVTTDWQYCSVWRCRILTVINFVT